MALWDRQKERKREKEKEREKRNSVGREKKPV